MFWLLKHYEPCNLLWHEIWFGIEVFLSEECLLVCIDVVLMLILMLMFITNA
jgi:hypothetical protein